MCVEVRRMGCHGEWERVLLVGGGGREDAPGGWVQELMGVYTVSQNLECSAALGGVPLL